jgi:hypothetical protein
VVSNTAKQTGLNCYSIILPTALNRFCSDALHRALLGMNFRSRATESLKAQPLRDSANQEHMFQKYATANHYVHPVENSSSAPKRPISLAQHFHPPGAPKSVTLMDLVAQQPPPQANNGASRGSPKQPTPQRVSFFDDGEPQKQSQQQQHTQSQPRPRQPQTLSSLAKQPQQHSSSPATVTSPVVPLAPRPEPHWAADHFKSTYQELGQSPTAFAKRAANRTLDIGTKAIISTEKHIPAATSTDIGKAPNAFATRAPNLSLHRGTNAITYQF